MENAFEFKNMDNADRNGDANRPVISVEQGLVRGFKKITKHNKKGYYVFNGIPYAEKPTDHLRFKPPVPSSNWKGVLDAEKEKDDCIQYSFVSQKIHGSEDCLHLNVSIPELPSECSKPKAVFVNIHCGGFIWGSGSCTRFGSPEYIIKHDVLFVSINYRLHALGFLNLGIPECPGNVGLKDIVLALKWIKRNIHSFGGDPDNMTAIGSSSGATAVHLLMISPLSKGLINKAILQGNHAFSPAISYQPDPLDIAFNYGKFFGYQERNPSQLLSILQKQPALTLTATMMWYRKIMSENSVGNCRSWFPFLPSIETIEEGAFLPRCPIQLKESVEPIPTIYGICEKEGLFMFSTEDTYKAVRADFMSVVKKSLWQYEIDENILSDITEKLSNFYFKNYKKDSELFPKAVDFYTDLWTYAVYRWLINQLLEKKPGLPVYIYMFSYVGVLNGMLNWIRHHFVVPMNGACHSDDLHYWLPIPEDPKPRKEDRNMINVMTTFFTNFAKTGNPNNDDDAVQWPQTTIDNHCFLKIDKTLEVVQGILNEDRLTFFVNILDDLMKEHELH